LLGFMRDEFARLGNKKRNANKRLPLCGRQQTRRSTFATVWASDFPPRAVAIPRAFKAAAI